MEYRNILFFGMLVFSLTVLMSGCATQSETIDTSVLDSTGGMAASGSASADSTDYHISTDQTEYNELLYSLPIVCSSSSSQKVDDKPVFFDAYETESVHPDCFYICGDMVF